MSFRKRNVAIQSPPNSSSTLIGGGKEIVAGTRPSPLDGRLTISTGTRSLDSLLSGHAGIPLGTSLLVEENGTTDFGSILLRYFAAEGVVQGHHVHVLGADEGWGRELPGLAALSERLSSGRDDVSITGAKMKIAWRYERLGEFGRDRGQISSSPAQTNKYIAQSIFCHDFDLSKRLPLSSPPLMFYIGASPQLNLDLEPANVSKSAFSRFIQHLLAHLSGSPPSSIHRIVIPSVLSPAAYSNKVCVPGDVIPFVHSLRALLRKYPDQLAAIITLPAQLYPRMTGLTRWIEILNDAVIELAPFPSHTNLLPTISQKPAAGQGELPQGMVKVHRLPIFHEKGGRGVDWKGLGDDMTFTLSMRKGLVIKPFNLPPIDGNQDRQQTDFSQQKLTRGGIDF